MRIGIDARFLTHPQRGGFKTYTQNLVAALAAVDTENEYVLYVDRPVASPTQLVTAPNMALRVVPGTMPLLGMPWREQIGLPAHALKDRIDVLHAPALTAPLGLPCPCVVTIYDTIWLFPDRFSKGGASSRKRALMKRYYQLLPQLAARRAAAIITVSHASGDEIVRHLHVSPERVAVTYLAAAPSFRCMAEDRRRATLRERYGLGPAYILAIGSADPRKNLDTLLRAYAQLPAPIQQRFPLAIVWTHQRLASHLAAHAAALGIEGRLRFLERVSDEDLAQLYSGASAFVFPSLYEGFGLPILEAMSCGAPVVAADNSSIPEIAGDAALLVPAEDPRQMARALLTVLDDPVAREQLVAKGYQRARRFSWARCARETMAVYTAVHLGRTPAQPNTAAQQ